jgi:hypothetical protein
MSTRCDAMTTERLVERRGSFIPQPSLQLKMIGTFVALSAIAFLLQGLMLCDEFANTASSSAGDAQVAGAFGLQLAGRMQVFLVCLALVVAVGIAATFRWAGPVWRFEQYLDAIAADRACGPCRIRRGDELQQLCERINAAIVALRGKPWPEAVSGAPASARSRPGFFRRKRLIKPALQWKLIGTFAALQAMTLLAQELVLRWQLARHGIGPGIAIPADVVYWLVGQTQLLAFLIGLPLTVGVGARVTFRFAGPIYRFEQHFAAIARGEEVGPCRIRAGDDLQLLCTRIDAAVEALRARRAAEAARDAALVHRTAVA